MSATGLDVFDTTLQKTHEWLQDLMQEMGWEDRHRAYTAYRGVFHALRDRLSVDQAVHLASQIPMLMRGFYYEGWHPANKPLRYRHREEFISQVGREVPGMETAELEKTATAVFTVMNRHLPAGEVEKVKDDLPLEVRELWP